mgnify:CR=1 FL=1
MKKALLLIAVFLFSYNINAQEHKEYFKSGKLKVTGTLEDEIKTGTWNYYFKNGKISKTGNYKGDKLHGEWKYFHDNGKLRIIGKYDNGNDFGLWKYFHKNGKLRAVGYYTDGEMTGKWKYYHDDGSFDKFVERGNAKKDIEKVLDYYFEGTKTDNPDLLRKAFLPDATLKFINNKGDYNARTIETFFSYFKNTKTRSFESKIYYINIYGTTANVKLSTKYKTYQYIDYMNMLKTKDGWKIVSKISHQEFFKTN